MRRYAPVSPADVPAAPGGKAVRSDWATLQRLFPYLWDYKWRVMLALGFMVAAKGANVGVPLLLKQLVDAMTPQAGGRSLLGSPPLPEVLIVPLLAFDRDGVGPRDHQRRVARVDRRAQEFKAMGIKEGAWVDALEAARKQLDLVGFLFVAAVTGIGGGTNRRAGGWPG